MPGKKGMKHYPRAIKLKAVRLFIEEGKKQAEIAEQHYKISYKNWSIDKYLNCR